MPRARARQNPAIPLRAALARLSEFHARFGAEPAPARLAGSAWGYRGDYLPNRIIAALGYYGLLSPSRDLVDGARRRRLAVSSDGLAWLRSEDEALRRAIVQRAALRPTLFAKYARAWGAARPLKPSPEYDAAVAQLAAEGFTAKSAAGFISVLYDSIEFAGLANDGNHDLSVRKVELDTQIGSKLTKACQTSDNDANAGQSRANDGQALAKLTKADQTSTKAVMLYERFSIDEGDVSLTYPANLTADGFDNLQDYMHSFLRKVRRRIGLPPSGEAAPLARDMLMTQGSEIG